jgi:hypothetical protein
MSKFFFNKLEIRSVCPGIFYTLDYQFKQTFLFFLILNTHKKNTELSNHKKSTTKNQLQCLFVILIVNFFKTYLRISSLIKFLIVFTAERRLIQTSAVSQLKDTRLGIDGNYWLRKIVSKENTVTAMGGLPLKLVESIEKELGGFK